MKNMKRLLATIALTGSSLSLAAHAHADDPIPDQPTLEAPADLDQFDIGVENAVQSIGDVGGSINDLYKQSGGQVPIIEIDAAEQFLAVDADE
ncbi:hypothetical protein [Streptomyces huasconensis]|uniref:hypothetical protein n=1 Tax=Streptomyces huasconensis TaxID=1854574 RepID=UPI0033EB925F